MTRHLPAESRYSTLPLLGLIVLSTLWPSKVSAQLNIETKGIAERVITRLPAGPLFWRIETLPAQARENVSPGPTSVAASVSGEIWLFTLGRMGDSTPGANKVAELGPVPSREAAVYVLRVHHVRRRSGAKAPMHKLAESETFYVRAGRLGVSAPPRVRRAGAGQGMVWYGAERPAELFNAGTGELDYFALRVGSPSKKALGRFLTDKEIDALVKG